MSGENEAADVRVPSSSVLSLESDDMDSSRISDAVTQSCISGNSCDQGRESTLLEYIVSSSQIGRLNDSVDDLADHCMETIELDDEVKLGESCVIVDSDVLHAFSRRSGRLRSYKEQVLNFFHDAYHDEGETLVVPESLKMRKKMSNHREVMEMKTYRPKNRQFVTREDCSDILDWIKRTQQ